MLARLKLTDKVEVYEGKGEGLSRRLSELATETQFVHTYCSLGILSMRKAESH